MTSYGQMNNIFQYGCYFVGSGEAHICHNYSDVIVLKLKKSKSITKIEYNLEELRDLESKLVLITGSKAEYRENVDIFIDVRSIPLLRYSFINFTVFFVGSPQCVPNCGGAPCTPASWKC